MFGKRGSLSVEAVIIVPGILILMLLFILVWINFFRYSSSVITTHQAHLSDQTFDAVEVEFNWFDAQKVLTYVYEPSVLTTRFVQQVIEYLFYLYVTYHGRFDYE